MVLRRLGLLTILSAGLAFAACDSETGDDDDGTTTGGGTTAGTTTGGGTITGSGAGTTTGSTTGTTTGTGAGSGGGGTGGAGGNVGGGGAGGGTGGGVQGSGDTCADPADISGVTTWPLVTVGDFTDDPAAGSTCDGTPTNTIWYEFTPGATDQYNIYVENGTNGTGWVGIAVFTTTACSPLGTEVGCVDATDYEEFLQVDLVSGTTYLIIVHTEDDQYTMEDPEITVMMDGETACADAVDNELDQLFDCQDTDCQSDAACVPGAGALHSPCTAHTDCATFADNDPICLDETNWGWPNGQCMDTCNVTANDCGTGGVCAQFVDTPIDTGMCMKLCPNGDSDCRTGDGYSCITFAVGDVCWQ